MSIYQEATLMFDRLTEGHIARLLPIEHEAYPDPWTTAMFRQEIENPASYFCVASIGEQIVGYGGYWFVIDEMHVTKITVAPEIRGIGYGRRLMEHLEYCGRDQGALTSRLEVRESNMAARHLYTHMGYRPIGLRKGYYAKTNETAVVMSKALAADLSG